MPQSFASYTEVSVNAFKFNPKNQEVIERKQEILRSVAQHYNSNPTSILFYGFSPLILAATAKMIAVTDINDEIKKLLDSTGIKYVYIKESELPEYKKQFSWVVASDEYFTFATTEQQQLSKVQAISDLTQEVIITTLRDYKNQDYRDKEFSQPLAVRNGSESKVFLEYHEHDYSNRTAWNTTVYEMQGSETKVSGPFPRRSMFFKQMAKFSIDAGAKQFYVHKDLMYKSLIKKNYEHVISISF
jgi:hypothetical protein